MIVADRRLAVVAGVDAATKRDSAAVALCAWQNGRVRLVSHKIFTPRPDAPIDLEATLEAALLDYQRRFDLREIWYDPFQFARSAQTLQKAGLNLHEFAQSPPNQTKATSNLLELLKSASLVAYPDDQIRLAFQRAIVVESPRGLRIAKEKASHHIDVVVALSMAALGAVEVLSDEGGFDIGGTIVAVARSTADGVRHAVDSVGSLFTTDDTDDHPMPSSGQPDVVIEHPGVYDGDGRPAAVGRSAASHPANRSCGICLREQKDARVRAGVSYPAVSAASLIMRGVGRLGVRFLGEDDAAQRAMNDDSAYCGACQTLLKFGHLPSCPEFDRSMVVEPRCLSCRHPVGHESDCPVLTQMLNTSDPGVW
jgi:hypothetical protein